MGARHAAAAVELAVNAAAEVTAGVVEFAGNAAGDALRRLGAATRRTPVAGGVLCGLCGWLAGVVSAVLGLVAAVIKGGLGVIGGVVAGLTRILGGGFARGLGGAAASVAGAVVLVVGKLVAAGQTVLLLNGTERPLAQPEAALLRQVFGRSVALHRVRLVTGSAGLFSLNRRPFTLGNTIYLKRLDPATHPAVLVHECTHVWQYQHEGARYTVDALWAQATVSPDAYRWEDEFGRGRSHWRQFNKEAQAQFLEDSYRFLTEGAAEFTRDGRDYTTFAIQTAAHVRSATSTSGLSTADGSGSGRSRRSWGPDEAA